MYQSSQVAAGNNEGDVYLIGPGSCNELFIAKAYENAIRDITFSNSGDRLITAGIDKTVRMFDTVLGSEVFKYSLQNTPTCLALNQITNSLAIGNAAGHIVVVPSASKNVVF